MRALIISADDYEDSELRVPREQLQAAGIPTDVASLTPGRLRGKHGDAVAVDLLTDAIDVDAYDLLILPGGRAPAELRKAPAVLAVVRAFVSAGKPVAAICHGPQILLSAGVLRGHRATCYRSVAAELRQGGVHYIDKDVVVDGNLITSRQPADLPAFMQAIKQQLLEKRSI